MKIRSLVAASILFAVFSLLICSCTSHKTQTLEKSTEVSAQNAVSETAENFISEKKDTPKAAKSNILVAYFSCTGRTKTAAEIIAKELNADTFEIVPKIPYTKEDLDWNDKTSRSTMEMQTESSRPAIEGKVSDFKKYDIVFIGYPIWWNDAPRVISTFIESYNFYGKTIVIFATSGGSDISNSERILRKRCPEGAKWVSGVCFSDDISPAGVKAWLRELNFLHSGK